MTVYKLTSCGWTKAGVLAERTAHRRLCTLQVSHAGEWTNVYVNDPF